MILTVTEKKILDYIRSQGLAQVTWRNFIEAMNQCHVYHDSDEETEEMLRRLVHGGALQINMNCAEFVLVLAEEENQSLNNPAAAAKHWFVDGRHLCSRRLYADEMEPFLAFMRTHGHERQTASDALNKLMQEGKIHLEIANPPKQTIGLYYSP